MSRETAMAALQATIPSGQGNNQLNAPVVSSPTPTPAVSKPTDGSAPSAAVSGTELDSTRFNHLAKKEAEILKQRESFKKEQTEFMTERQKYQEERKRIDEYNTLKAKDPVAALKHLGFSEADLMNFMAANEDNYTPEERARKAAADEIQKFRDAQAKEKNDAQTTTNTQTISQFKNEIKATIANAADKFEYCNYNGPLAEDLIYETVYAVAKDSNWTETISATEAAEMVEQYYEDQDKAMSTLKKRQLKTETAPMEVLKPQVSPRPTQARTLSNKTMLL